MQGLIVKKILMYQICCKQECHCALQKASDNDLVVICVIREMESIDSGWASTQV